MTSGVGTSAVRERRNAQPDLDAALGRGLDRGAAADDQRALPDAAQPAALERAFPKPRPSSITRRHDAVGVVLERQRDRARTAVLARRSSGSPARHGRATSSTYGSSRRRLESNRRRTAMPRPVGERARAGE